MWLGRPANRKVYAADTASASMKKKLATEIIEQDILILNPEIF